MIERILQSWQAMALRERRLVGMAGLVLLLAFVYLALIEPAWKGRASLERELPVLRQQLSQMLSLAAEVRQLSAAPPAGARGVQVSRQALEQSAKASGLAASLQKVETNGDMIEMRFKSVSHAQWLSWLDTALRETRLRVIDLSVNREPSPGTVSVRVVFEASKRDAS